jgi:hypothetical protein
MILVGARSLSLDAKVRRRAAQWPLEPGIGVGGGVVAAVATLTQHFRSEHREMAMMLC